MALKGVCLGPTTKKGFEFYGAASLSPCCTANLNFWSYNKAGSHLTSWRCCMAWYVAPWLCDIVIYAT